MFTKRMLALVVGTATMLGPLFTASANASEADFPSRTARIVVPYAAGNPSDLFARWMADFMAQDLGQPIIVENRPGGNTIVGAQTAAGAPADGYTLFQATNSLVLNPLLYKKLTYDPAKLEVLGIAMEAPLILVINPKLPARNIEEFVAYAKTKDGGANYSSIGSGNAMQLATELLRLETGVPLTHVPYNGRGADAISAVMSGDVDMFITTASHATPHVQAGKLRALAVLSKERLKSLPDVPTTAELGVPRVAGTAWYALAINPETPQPIIDTWRASVNKAISSPGFIDRFSPMGLLPVPPRTGEETAKYVEEDRERWAQVIKQNNISLD